MALPDPAEHSLVGYNPDDYPRVAVTVDIVVFTIVDNDERELCKLTGKWTSWDFSFTAGDVELAHVSKKWAGIGKELLTSADNYILEVSDSVPPDSRVRKLILAAVMCIDMVLKE